MIEIKAYRTKEIDFNLDLPLSNDLLVVISDGKDVIYFRSNYTEDPEEMINNMLTHIREHIKHSSHRLCSIINELDTGLITIYNKIFTFNFNREGQVENVKRKET